MQKSYADRYIPKTPPSSLVESATQAAARRLKFHLAKVCAKVVCYLSFLAASLLLAGGNAQAQGERRVALVIANGQYEHAPMLVNPLADADLIALTLKAVNFSSVIVVRNGSLDVIRAALADFKQQADQADVALIYYAGHGMEVNKTNYLIPVDARLTHDADAAREALAAETLVQSVEGVKRLSIIILDACRDNPFASQMIPTKGTTRSLSRGLVEMTPVGDSLIVYSAKAGQVASDGERGNSPFARSLARRMTDRGTEIGLMFRKMRDDVLTETSGRQEPFTYGSISGREYYFLPPNSTSSGRSQFSMESELWSLCKTAASRSSCDEYLAKFPRGSFAELAKLRLGEFDRPATSATTPEPGSERMIASASKPQQFVSTSRTTNAAGRIPVINVGTISSAQDCRLYLASASQSTTYANPYEVANTTSSVSWLYKDCVTHFTGVRRSVQAALASTGVVTVGAGGLTLSGQLSKVSTDSQGVGTEGFTAASDGSSVTAVVTLRNAAGTVVYGTSVTKRIETADAYRSDSMTSGGEKYNEGAVMGLQNQLAMAIARKIAFHFTPPQITITDGKKIRLNVGAPMLEPGIFVDIAGSDGLTTIRYQIDSTMEGSAIASKVGDGDTGLVRVGAHATIIEPGDAAERQNVFDKVDLP